MYVFCCFTFNGKNFDSKILISRQQIEMTNKSTVSLQSLCHAIQTMGEKLTHLYLAHNKLAGVPQIVTALSVRPCLLFSVMR